MYTHPSRHIISRRAFTYAALYSVVLFTFGCMTPDEPKKPLGRLQVVHANPEEGAIEVLFENEVILTVPPGEVSEIVTLNQGDWVLSLRKAGAMSAYASTEAISFGDQLNVIALALDGDDEEIIYVTDEAPTAEEGTHHVRILDISNSTRSIKLFRGLSEIAVLPIEDKVSPFFPTEPDENKSYSLSDIETSAPLYQGEPLSSPAGGATLVIVQPSGSEEDELLLNILPLR